MTQALLVFGCGGHGRVVADTALDCGYDDVAFLDDVRSATSFHGERILGPMAHIERFVRAWPEAIAAVGAADMRLALFETLRQVGYRTPRIVHRSAIVSSGSQLGEGVFVAAGAIINTGARVGNAAIINTGARIDHDCSMGAGAHIAPGATLSGNVKVGEKAWLGAGCAVRQGISIGDGVVVGVGAAVVSDLEARKTYVGVPARILKNSI